MSWCDILIDVFVSHSSHREPFTFHRLSTGCNYSFKSTYNSLKVCPQVFLFRSAVLFVSASNKPESGVYPLSSVFSRASVRLVSLQQHLLIWNVEKNGAAVGLRAAYQETGNRVRDITYCADRIHSNPMIIGALRADLTSRPNRDSAEGSFYPGMRVNVGVVQPSLISHDANGDHVYAL